MRAWREAWQAALYGEDGFYRDARGPAGHFTTSSHGDLGRVLAEVVLGLAAEVGARTVVDLGAGRGELLTALAATGTELELVGVDVVDRPEGLPSRVGWRRSPGGGTLPDLPPEVTGAVLVVANEWLDVVPCTVAGVDGDGQLRVVLVDGAGGERLGDTLQGDELAWARRWWSTETPGERVEVGLDRDRAWAGMLRRWRPRAAVAVDYGHDRATRPPFGTLVGYRDGMQVPPVPDGRCDLTAHVAHDSLQQSRRLSQAEAVARWAPPAPLPDRSAAASDPLGYVAALSARSARTALRSGPMGDFTWTVWDSDDPGSGEG